MTKPLVVTVNQSRYNMGFSNAALKEKKLKEKTSLRRLLPPSVNPSPAINGIATPLSPFRCNPLPPSIASLFEFKLRFVSWE
ncbi:hypothetical protein Nepgr_010783 [Nepenthes gracilis]|uniref:Uncharacterized protein n=1 Tax=Nepenthes gracilis TaxID=150966 RepID=A0AAD3SD09_NEPGR|nr:hypothetical protein Nepgr_010783 [Nepenthes gracilis]